MPKTCPLCRGAVLKVIYYGLPHQLCADKECSCLFGFWARFTHNLPFNGRFLVYEGSYWPAFWFWLKGGAL